jgi:membrane protein required for colicin V production
MAWLDWAVIGVLAGSTALGAWRGLVREVLSILGWIIAFLAANLLAGPLGPEMPHAIPSAELRVAAAFVAVFLVALILASLTGLLLSRLVKAVGLGGTDRTLGAAFGAARGLLLVLAAAVLAGLTSAPRQAWWRESASGLLLAQGVAALRPLLPQTLAERLRY